MARTPPKAHAAPSVSERVAALQARTRPDDIPELVAIAATDRATSVRIVAATVAADILARTWLLEGTLAPSLVDTTRSALRPADPGANPALLQLDGELGDPLGRRRVQLAARDARPELRAGARAALQRAALSMRAHAEEDWARPLAVTLANDPRVSAEMRAELCRLGARVGWEELQPVAEALTRRTARPIDPPGRATTRAAPATEDAPPGVAAEAAAWARAHFHAVPPIAGVWVDEGADVYAAPPGPPTPRATYGLCDGSGWVRILAGDARVTRGHADEHGRPRRLLVRVGADEVPMLQLRDPDCARGVVTLRSATPRERAAFLDALAHTDRTSFDAIKAALPHDSETVGTRARAGTPRRPPDT